MTDHFYAGLLWGLFHASGLSPALLSVLVDLVLERRLQTSLLDELLGKDLGENLEQLLEGGFVLGAIQGLLEQLQHFALRQAPEVLLEVVHDLNDANFLLAYFLLSPLAPLVCA